MRYTFTVEFQVEVDLVDSNLLEDVRETLEDSELADSIQEAVGAHLALAPLPVMMEDLHGLTATKGRG